jgi:hypothetical protein
MRIQETDRILKEARTARHSAVLHQEESVMSRALRLVSSLPHKVAEMFRRTAG